METTAFATKPSPNPKGGLALLVKALATLSMQTVSPGRDSLFAGILDQKISQAAFAASTSDPTAVAPDGKPLPRVATKGVILNGTGKPATGGKAQRTAIDHPLSSTCNNRPFKGTADKTASEMVADFNVLPIENPTFEAVPAPIRSQPVMASSVREDAPFPLAGPAGKKSLSLTEKAEPTEDAKTAIHLVKGMREQAIAKPVTDESGPDADPSPTENVPRQIALPYEPDAALLAQAIKPQAAARPERETDEPPTERPILQEAAAPVNPASREIPPPSDRHADHRSPLEGAVHRTDKPFIQQAAETLQPNNHAPAADAAPAMNPTAAAAAPVNPASRELPPPSDRHADHRSPLEGAVHRTEKPFIRQAAETPQPNNDTPPADAAPAMNPEAAAAAASVNPTSREFPPPSDRHADHRSPLERAEHRTETVFIRKAAETPQPNNDTPPADAAPAMNPTTAAAAASVNPTSREVPLPSDRHADHRSPLEGAERPTEPASMTRTYEPLKQEKDRPAADAAPAKNPTAAVAAAPVNPASREVRTPSDRRADHRSPLEGAERRTEKPFIQRAAETLQPNNDTPPADAVLPDARQASPFRHDHWKRTGESKEGAWIAAAPQKPISAVGDGNATTGQAAPERMTPGGSPDKTFPIRGVVTETPGPAHDHQQIRNTIPHHPIRLSEHDMFPFRMGMPNVVSRQETNAPATAGSTGIEMQAVIDQILAVRQGVSNDFGRIRILLNPPNLGTVDLDIVVRGERVEVVMTAENATVQQALQSRGDDIRMALQRQDLKIEGFQVLLQDNGMGQQQTDSGAMYRQNREHRERIKANEDPPLAVPAFSSIAGAKSAAGLVSIFA